MISVKHYVSLTDTHGSTLVRRHTPVPDLREMTPVEELRQTIGSTNVTISPAKSACSETQIKVETDIGTLMARMKQELRRENEEWKAKTLKELEERDIRNREEIRYSLYITKMASLRLIEDFAIERMRTIIGLTETSTYAEITRQFTRHYEVPGLRAEDLKDLADSQSRREANQLLHLQRTQDEEIRVMFKSLKHSLSNEEIEKYEKLLKFGTGELKVKYNGGGEAE